MPCEGPFGVTAILAQAILYLYHTSKLASHNKLQAGGPWHADRSGLLNITKDNEVLEETILASVSVSEDDNSPPPLSESWCANRLQ